MLKNRKPFTRVAVIRQVEMVPPNVFEARERCIELRLVRLRIVGAEARDEPVFVSMPFAVNVDRIIELVAASLLDKSRLQHLVDEFLAGGRDREFLARRRLVAGASPDKNPVTPPRLGHR